MADRRGGGHDVGGLPYEIFNFLGSSFTKHHGEIETDGKKCKLCKKCQLECSRHAIYINRKSKMWRLYPNRCDLCLQCVRECPNGALSVVKK